MNKFKINTITLVILLSTLAACTNQTPEDLNQNSGNQSEDINLGVSEAEEESENSDIVEEIKITEITWQWIRFDNTAEINNITVVDPSLYTLTLNPDGSYSAKVDCNQIQGNYTLDASSLTFEPGITTLAECGPDSHYYTFIEQLGNVAAFVIDGDRLVLNLSDNGGSMIFAPAKDSGITGITWQWIRFDDTAGINNIVVADPTLYTLTLNPDGSYSAKVDCNQTAGGYTLDASSLTFEPGITTLAECGPDSHYYTFIEQLSNVAAFVFDGENLVLNLWADGGSMVFEPIE